jgi:hypothetical protein
LTCDIDERWNGPPPRCEPIRCDPPAVVAHSQIQIDEIDIEEVAAAAAAAPTTANATARSLFVGSIVTYTCDKGYRLIGNRQLLCLPTGSYDRAAPTCTGTRCNEIKSPLLRVLEEFLAIATRDLHTCE